MDYQYEGVVTALSSISHIGETVGVNAKLRREKLVTPNGIEEVPVISGNSLRGQLRDAGMLYMCRQLGYATNGHQVQGLPLPAFYFRFSGVLTRWVTGLVTCRSTDPDSSSPCSRGDGFRDGGKLSGQAISS